MVSSESRVGSESGKDTLLDMLRLNRQTGPIASDSCTCAMADSYPPNTNTCDY